MIKLPGQRKLVYKHKWVWEQATGKKVPKAHNIVFKDGDNLNTNIENLECISNAELMRRNTIHRYPQELVSQIRKVSKLKKLINN